MLRSDYRMIPRPAAFTMGIQHDPGTLFAQGEFVIPSEARQNHTAIFGMTGAGKSSLARNMIAEDIAAGIGVTVLDPHGQLVGDVLENHIPRERTGDVIYFNPRDAHRAIVVNLLDSPGREFDNEVAQNAVGIFSSGLMRSPWARAWKIFFNSFRALIEHPSPLHSGTSRAS